MLGHHIEVTKLKLFLLLLSVVFLLSPVNALMVTSSKIVYTPDENLTLSGNISSSATLTLKIYNSSDVLKNSTDYSVNTTFDILFPLANYTNGEYYSLLSTSSEEVKIKFRVLEQKVNLVSFFTGNSSNSVIVVNTTTLATGNNFSDLNNLNKSAVYNGTYTIGSDTYYFAVLDRNKAGTFDTVYIDDDSNFALYNTSEDANNKIEQEAGVKDVVDLNGTKYLIAGINEDGEKVILVELKEEYDFTVETNLFVLATYENMSFCANCSIDFSLTDSSGNSISTNSSATNNAGYAIFTFNVSSSGKYKISLNKDLALIDIFVDSFKLYGYTTDKVGTITNQFSKNSTVYIVAIAKDNNNNPINPNNPTAEVTTPKGEVSTISLTKRSDGVYNGTYESASEEGNYKIKITGTHSSKEQSFVMGFSVSSSSLFLTAVNMDFVDKMDKGGPGVMVSAFSPDDNVTVAVMQLSEKGFGMNGPDTIDIINSTHNCSSRLELIDIVDELGTSYKNLVDYAFYNITEAMNLSGMSSGETPEEMGKQCILMINNLNKTGVYKVKVKLDGKRLGSTFFGIQHLIAEGSLIGESGGSGWFVKPNTTAKMKIELTDLKTREKLNSSDLLDVSIVDIHREFPTYEDVFSDIDYRNNINDSFSNSTLYFNSPSSEGFYFIKFRYKANYNGSIEYGTGESFFMVKKYIIYAEPANAEEGKWFSKQGEPVTLNVNIMDPEFAGSSTPMCSGCEGLIVEVNGLKNDQLMKEFNSSDYNSSSGVIMSSTSGANVTISGNLPTGWYGVNVVLKNNETGDEYFGWGGFEIRNFFINAFPVTVEDGNYYGEFDRGKIYKFGSDVLFGVFANDVLDWQPIDLKNITFGIDSLMKMEDFGMPSEDVTNILNVSGVPSIVNVTLEDGPGEGIPMMLFNLTVDVEESDTSDIYAVIKGDYDGSEDIGTFWFSFSNYTIYISVEGGLDEEDDKEGRVFSRNQNVTIIFKGCELPDNGSCIHPHNLTNVTIFEVFDEKTKMPDTELEDDYNVVCVNNTCNLTLYMENFTSDKYFVEFEVEEQNGSKVSEEMMFRIKNLVLNIPEIRDRHTNRQEVVYGDFSVNNDRDICENELWTNGDNNGESRFFENKVISNLTNTSVDLDSFVNHFNCSDQSINKNLTVSQVYENDSAGAFCVMKTDYDKVCKDGCNNGSCSGDYTRQVSPSEWVSGKCPNSGIGYQVYVYSNGSSLWIGEDTINLSTSPPLNEDDKFHVGNFSYFVKSVGKDWQGQDNSIFFEITSADIKINNCGTNYTFIVNKKYDYNQAGVYCLREGSTRYAYDIENCSNIVYIISNGSTIWVNNDTNMTDAPNYTINDNFTEGGKNWTVLDIEDDRFKVKRANEICGRAWTQQGGEIIIELIPPQSDDNFYFGRQYFKEVCEGMDNCTFEKPIYFYNNGTEVWMTNETNMTGANHNATNKLILDPYGGLWNITSINKEEITLSGLNVSSGSYIFVNTSLSKSKIFMRGEIETEEGEDEMYFLVADTNSAGVYDSLIVSNDSENFFDGDVVSVNSNQSERKLSEDLDLYLLSIDPRGNKVMLYKNRTGDWPELGDYKSGDNITIPVLVKIPGGGTGEVNLSIDKARNDETGQLIVINSNKTTCNSDLCEIKINPADYSLDSGGYAFGIVAEYANRTEKLEDWKWPRATIRKYLVTTYSGYSHIISGFEPANIERFWWETYGEIRELRKENRCGNKEIVGVMLGSHSCLVQDCNITGGDYNNTTVLQLDGGNRYFLLNKTSRVFYKSQNESCYFNMSDLGAGYSNGSEINLTLDRNYTLMVLGVTNCSDEEWYLDFGIAGINSSKIKSLLNSELRWRYMQKLNISGTLYNVILAGGKEGEDLSSPACSNGGECSRAAFFDTDLNFSNSVGVKVGENFTSGLYLAGIGPQSYEGITVSNISSLGVKLWFSDDTISYYTQINESEQDFDMNKATNKNFTIIVYDGKKDGIQELTEVAVDDDSEVAEIGDGDNYYDFYGNETGSKEHQNRLPTDIWTDSIRFGDEQDNLSWEKQPSWNVMYYNNTSMIIAKHKWCLDENDTFGAVIKTYEFNRTPISGANISVEKIYKFGFGFTILSEGSNYNVNYILNQTNDGGYGVLKISPNSSWDYGEYMVVIKLESNKGTEKIREHFRIGDCNMGGKQ